MTDERGGASTILRGGVSRRRRVLGGLLVAALVGLGGCSSDDEDANEDLVGTWLFSRGPTWEISDDSISVSGGVVDGFDYTATNTTLELTDWPGPSACPPDQPGTYEWEIDDDVLSLTVVSDECGGRRDALDGATFERVE